MVCSSYRGEQVRPYVIAKLGEAFATLLPLTAVRTDHGWAVANGIDPKARPQRKKLFYDRRGEPVGFVFDRTPAQLWAGRPERFTP